ncbi:hypothetical protein PGTUg99_027900 [Puccinia graminis f. sp. tritici]|nr:hypothetical protein PGTUg99_027900 [Puccinia graminis f. sp. tritici]
MVTAHAAYWTDNRFARLVLIGLFGEESVLEHVGELENPISNGNTTTATTTTT